MTSDWAAYREEAFGEPYLVWHDGPDFTEFQSRFAADPELATRMLAEGLAEGDQLAAQTPRELRLTDDQRAVFVEMLTDPVRGAHGGVRLEAGASLFALTGDPSWSSPIVEVLLSPMFWSVRIDAAMRLRAFPPTPDLVAALAAGVRDPEYLVRYHSATTLHRWAGHTDEISDDATVFPLITSDATPERWDAAAEQLVAAVTA